MSAPTALFHRWRKGDELTSQRLNGPGAFLNRLYGPGKPRESAALGEPDLSTDTADANGEGLNAPAATWRFMSATTTTERIEDETDSSIYIDVTRTQSLTLELADGRRIVLQLEDLTDGA